MRFRFAERDFEDDNKKEKACEILKRKVMDIFYIIAIIKNVQ